jgi:hypothetical protein
MPKGGEKCFLALTEAEWHAPWNYFQTDRPCSVDCASVDKIITNIAK